MLNRRSVGPFYGTILALTFAAYVSPGQVASAPVKCDFAKYKPLRGTFEGKVIRERAEAKYPKEADSKGVTGTVKVEVLVDGTGLPVRACALTGPAILRSASIEAALRFKFVPILINEEPVPFAVHQMYFQFLKPGRSGEAK